MPVARLSSRCESADSDVAQRWRAGSAFASRGVVLGEDAARGIKWRVEVRRLGYRPEHACAGIRNIGRGDAIHRRDVEPQPLIASRRQAIELVDAGAVGLEEQVASVGDT